MQLTKRNYFQLAVLFLLFLIYLLFKSDYLGSFIFILITLCAVYITNPGHKYADYLRAILYGLAIYFVFTIIYDTPDTIRILSLFHENITFSQMITSLYNVFYWQLLYILILVVALLFNKPVTGRMWFKNLIGKFKQANRASN